MKHAQNLNVPLDDKGETGRTTPSTANKRVLEGREA